MTLMEMLLVVGIIAIVGLFSAVAISSARSRMRDTKRVADVRQFQSVLEDYYQMHNAYPEGQGVRLGDPTTSRCLLDGGFAPSCRGASSVFMNVVPAEYPKGIGDVKCGNPAQTGYCYTRVADGASYQLGFEIEHGIQEVGIEKGANCLIPEAGIRSGICPE